MIDTVTSSYVAYMYLRQRTDAGWGKMDYLLKPFTECVKLIKAHDINLKKRLHTSFLSLKKLLIANKQQLILSCSLPLKILLHCKTFRQIIKIKHIFNN